MDPEHRRRLEERAFPEQGVGFWRAQLFVTFIVALIGGLAASSGLVTVVVLATAVPTAVRYVRRELALGALLAYERREARKAERVPDEDLRDMPRPLQ